MKRHFVNLFGACSYLAIILEWMWLFILYIPLLLEHHVFDWTIPKPSPTPSEQFHLTFALPSLLTLVIASVVTALVIVITLYILIKIPIEAVKKSHTLTTEASEKVIPVLTHHKHISKKRKVELSARIILYIKLALIVVAVCALLPTQFIQTGLPSSIGLFIGIILALFAALALGLQIILARLLHVPTEQLL